MIFNLLQMLIGVVLLELYKCIYIDYYIYKQIEILVLLKMNMIKNLYEVQFY